MICMDAPGEAAVVDRVEADWARVEVSSSLLLDVPRERLPAEVREGHRVCYCKRDTSALPWLFRRCPPVLNPVFSNERRAQWSQ